MQKGSFTCKVHRLVNRLWLDLYLGQLWTCWLEVVVQKHPSVLQVHHWKPDLCWSWNWCSSQSLWEKQWSPDCWTIPCQTHTKLPSHFSAHNLINTKKKDVKLPTHSAPAFLLGWGLRGPSRCRLTRRWLFLFFGIYTLHLKLLQHPKHMIYTFN